MWCVSSFQPPSMLWYLSQHRLYNSDTYWDSIVDFSQIAALFGSLIPYLIAHWLLCEGWGSTQYSQLVLITLWVTPVVYHCLKFMLLFHLLLCTKESSYLVLKSVLLLPLSADKLLLSIAWCINCWLAKWSILLKWILQLLSEWIESSYHLTNLNIFYLGLFKILNGITYDV